MATKYPSRTVVVPSSQIRAVLAAIRANGGFITRASLVGANSYTVTFTRKR